MIDLPTAKLHLRVDSDEEDDLIAGYLLAAQGSIQKYTSKLLAQTPVVQQRAGFPLDGGPIRLWLGPVATGGVASIAYDDQNGVSQTLDPSQYRLVVDGQNAKLLPAYGINWPPAQEADGSVTIKYTAGFPAGEVPPEIDQATLLLTGHYYANREAAIADNRAAAVELPLGIEMLLANYQNPGIA